MTDFIDRLEDELLAAGRRPRGTRLARRAGLAGRSAGTGGAVLLSLAVVVAVMVALLGAGHGRPSAPASLRAAGKQPAACSFWVVQSRGESVLGQLPAAFLGGGRAGALCSAVAQYGLAATRVPSGTATEIEHRGQYAISVRVTVPLGAPRDYGVWVVGSSGGSRLLGVVRVGRVPRAIEKLVRGAPMAALGLLPAGATRFAQVLITRETSAAPSRPGPVVLRLKSAPVQPLCILKAVSSTPPATDAQPSQSLLSILGVLRAPVTAADALDVKSLFPFPTELSPTNGVYVRYMRVVGDAGIKLMVVPYLRGELIDPSCPGLAQPLRRLRAQQRAAEQRLLAHPQQEVGVFARIGHASLGEFVYGNAAEIERGSTLAVDGVNTGYRRSVLVALVPDGVSRVSVYYAGRIMAPSGKWVPAPPVTITMTVHGNVIVGNIPRPAGNLPQRVTWYGAGGRVVKSYVP